MPRRAPHVGTISRPIPFAVDGMGGDSASVGWLPISQQTWPSTQKLGQLAHGKPCPIGLRWGLAHPIPGKTRSCPQSPPRRDAEQNPVPNCGTAVRSTK